ncbi:MAG: hypothetical protein V3V78_00730 [Candidatus Woesearchaeota archaeon]
MNTEKYFLLNLKKLFMIIGAFILAVLLHNFISALIGIEEPVFFLIAVIIIPLYFLTTVGYTIFHHVKKKK